MTSFGLVVVVISVLAVFYYRLAAFENRAPVAWAAMSILSSLVCYFVLGFGWVGLTLSQIFLFGLMFVLNIFRQPQEL